MSDSGFSAENNLYPAERNAIIAAIHAVQSKNIGRSDSLTALSDITKELKDRLRAIGFGVEVTFETEAGDDGHLYKCPVIEDLWRLSSIDTDHERMANEIQGGALDGVEGVVKQDGTLGEKSRKHF